VSSAGAEPSGFLDFFGAATGREPSDFLLGLAEHGLAESIAVPGNRAEVVLAWLWRRLHGPDRKATPRRLIYALPQHSLTEPVAIQVGDWLTRAGLIDQVALHVVPGGPDPGGPRWRRDMHSPAIVIGCADYLVSKALNRSFGSSATMWPIDFALVTNGAQWVFEDAERCERSAATIRQLVSAATRVGTAEPLKLTCLSGAAPPVRTLHAQPSDHRAVAAAVAAVHQPGTRTLIAAKSVTSATALYSAVADLPVPRVLIHSQFRGVERQALADAVVGDPGDRGQIVVATLASREGIDAACVVSEPAADPAPASSDEPFLCLPALCLPALPSLTELFGAEAPVLEFLDSPDDLEAQLIWATWADAGPPPEETWLPGEEWRCRAPLALIDALASRAQVWRIDRAQGGWTALSPQQAARPGEILLVAASDGGYDPVLGFDPQNRVAVGGSPSVDPVPMPAGAAGAWVSLRKHSEETRDQAAALLAVTVPELPGAVRRAVECAAYLHDVGKAHPIWQDALCALAPDPDRATIDGGRPWAKSGLEARLEFAGDVRFRHELASLLLIDGPLRGLIDERADRDLVRYLVLAHHGRLRLRVGEGEPGVIHGLAHGTTWPMPPVLDQPATELAVDLAQFEAQPGLTAGWTATVLRLLERYGPFTLAYLETLVRVADWRASGGEPLPPQ
jgi:CRISPR-associated endonuclease/helicase Cas3